jgi:DNA polymerase III subunit chi
VIVDFYQLSATPLERVLPRICERLLETGERLLIVVQPEQLDRLDQLLWTYKADSFLPHARAGADAPERQPILLAPEAKGSNDARNIALADGRWRDEALQFDRTFYFFDSNGAEEARQAWRQLGGREGLERRYWRQENGKWVQGP